MKSCRSWKGPRKPARTSYGRGQWWSSKCRCRAPKTRHAPPPPYVPRCPRPRPSRTRGNGFVNLEFDTRGQAAVRESPRRRWATSWRRSPDHWSCHLTRTKHLDDRSRTVRAPQESHGAGNDDPGRLTCVNSASVPGRIPFGEPDQDVLSTNSVEASLPGRRTSKSIAALAAGVIAPSLARRPFHGLLLPRPPGPDRALL